MASVPLTYIVCFQITRSWFAALFAAALLATNIVLLTYARMLKPYTADVCFAALLILLANRALVSSNIRDLWAYATTLAIGSLLSFGALFVGVGASMLLFADALIEHDGRRFPRLVLVHLAVLVVALPYALLFLWPQSGPGYLHGFWSAGFPTGKQPIEIVSWAAKQTWQLAQYLFTPIVGVLLGAITGVGVMVTLRREPRSVALLAAPYVLAICAALAGVYPFEGEAGRILLFLLPSCAILAGAGMAWLVEHASSVRLAPLAYLPIVVALAPALRLGQPYLDIPGMATEETRDLIRGDLLPSLRSGDLIYVYYGAGYAFQYYAPAFNSSHVVDFGDYALVDNAGVQAVYGAVHSDAPDNYREELQAAIRTLHPSRLWMLFSHVMRVPEGTEENLLVSAAATCGVRETIAVQQGATLYRLDNVKCPTS